MFIEYPKSLYLHGWDDLDACVIVRDEQQEAQARSEGYRMLSEPEQDPQDDAPAESPKKRGRPRKTDSEPR